MKTLLDKVCADFQASSVLDFDSLLKSYNQDKYMAKSSHYLKETGNLQLLQEAKGNMKQIRKELEKTASLKFAINTALEYTEAANNTLDEFLRDKEGMYWFQLKAFFNNLSLQLKGIGGSYFERI